MLRNKFKIQSKGRKAFKTTTPANANAKISAANSLPLKSAKGNLSPPVLSQAPTRTLVYWYWRKAGIVRPINFCKEE